MFQCGGYKGGEANALSLPSHNWIKSVMIDKNARLNVRKEFHTLIQQMKEYEIYKVQWGGTVQWAVFRCTDYVRLNMLYWYTRL